MCTRPRWITLAAMLLAVTAFPLAAAPAGVATVRDTAQAVATGQFQCPPDDNFLTTGGLYHNTADPSTFWQCDLSRRAVLKTCPEGTQFNEKARVCDWPPSPTFRLEEDYSLTEQPEGASDIAPAAAGATRARPAAAGLGAEVTYVVDLKSDQWDLGARFSVAIPPGMIWVGGQNCYDYDAGDAVCLANPDQDGLAPTEFTLRFGLLALGPQTVAVHFAASDPASANAVLDHSLTCTAVIGLVVIC